MITGIPFDWQKLAERTVRMLHSKWNDVSADHVGFFVSFNFPNDFKGRAGRQFGQEFVLDERVLDNDQNWLWENVFHAPLARLKRTVGDIELSSAELEIPLGVLGGAHWNDFGDAPETRLVIDWFDVPGGVFGDLRREYDITTDGFKVRPMVLMARLDMLAAPTT